MGAIGAAAVGLLLATLHFFFVSSPHFMITLADLLKSQAPESLSSAVSKPATGAFESFSAPEASLTLLLPGASLLALSLILVDPLLSRAMLVHFPAARQVSAGWPISLASTLFVGYVGFGRGTSLAEMMVGGVAWTGELPFFSFQPSDG